MLRTIFIMVFVAVLSGCASGPADKPVAQLSGADARVCSEEADLYNALATLRKNNVAKRQAVSQQMKHRNVSSLGRAERKAATSEVFESAIIVYAVPDLSPATLYALKWSECKVKALENRELNYGEILAVKEEVTRCQNEYAQKGANKLQACVDRVVGNHSKATGQPEMVSRKKCRSTISKNIKLHKKAVRLAKKGKKNTALDSLEASLASWKTIASGGLSCSNVERAIATDGILRADQDINTIARVY